MHFLLFVCAILCFSTLARAAGKTLSGSIFDDQEWMLQDSPIQITGNTTIQASASVVIEPGVLVLFAKNSPVLMVKGRLVANGTFAQPVTFRGNGGQFGSIYIKDRVGGSLSANFVRFESLNVALWRECCFRGQNGFMTNTSFLEPSNFLTFQNNRVALQGVGGDFFSFPATTNSNYTIFQSTFVGNNIVVNASYVRFQSCIFRGNGVIVPKSVGPAYFVSSQIQNSTAPIALEGNGNLDNCLVSGNKIAISGQFSIFRSTISLNAVGVREYNTWNGIKESNIFNNTMFNMVVKDISDDSIDRALPNIYWGTTNVSLIRQKIYDARQDASLGVVNVQPVSETPFGNSWTAGSTPSPTTSWAPGTSSWAPGTSSWSPGTSSWSPGTSSWSPGTSSWPPASTTSQWPGTPTSWAPGTSQFSPGTTSWSPGTSSWSPGTSSWPPGSTTSQWPGTPTSWSPGTSSWSGTPTFNTATTSGSGETSFIPTGTTSFGPSPAPTTPALSADP